MFLWLVPWNTRDKPPCYWGSPILRNLQMGLSEKPTTDTTGLMMLIGTTMINQHRISGVAYFQTKPNQGYFFGCVFKTRDQWWCWVVKERPIDRVHWDCEDLVETLWVDECHPIPIAALVLCLCDWLDKQEKKHWKKLSSFHLQGSTNFYSIMASTCTPTARKQCTASASCAFQWTRGRLLPCNSSWPGWGLSRCQQIMPCRSIASIAATSLMFKRVEYMSPSYGKVLHLLWMVRHSEFFQQIGKRMKKKPAFESYWLHLFGKQEVFTSQDVR